MKPDESSRDAPLANVFEYAWRRLGRPHPGTKGHVLWSALAAVAESSLTRPAAEHSVSIDEVREVLAKLLDHYVQLAGSGDCGNWDPEKEPEVIASRALLTQLSGDAQPEQGGGR